MRRTPLPGGACLTTGAPDGPSPLTRCAARGSCGERLPEEGRPVSAERALLVITDPAARSADGESVRVALDVLRAAAPAKIVVPSDAAELERALVRRGRRRVVLVGGDGGMHAVVRVLERH